MDIGLVGLGKMGGNMALRLAQGVRNGHSKLAHQVIAYSRDPNPSVDGEPNIQVFNSLDHMVAALQPPRVIWVMVPSGNPTESVVTQLADDLSQGDILIDGGNSYYKDSMRRAEGLARRGIGFLDVGTSGGVWGRHEGYCLMIGGEDAYVEHCRPIFDTLAPRDGWAHVGGSGAGHFVKMIHNGIEYGLMEAYGEGFEVLRKSGFDIDLAQVAAVWNRGSVIRSWLLELAERMLALESDLSTIQPVVEDSGEGRWTIQAALEEEVPVPVIAASLFARFESRDPENFSARFCAALRKQFGGHDVVQKDVTEKAESRGIESDGSSPPPDHSHPNAGPRPI